MERDQLLVIEFSCALEEQQTSDVCFHQSVVGGFKYLFLLLQMMFSSPAEESQQDQLTTGQPQMYIIQESQTWLSLWWWSVKRAMQHLDHFKPPEMNHVKFLWCTSGPEEQISSTLSNNCHTWVAALCCWASYLSICWREDRNGTWCGFRALLFLDLMFLCYWRLGMTRWPTRDKCLTLMVCFYASFWFLGPNKQTHIWVETLTKTYF